MNGLLADDYNPPSWLKNGHVNTMYTYYYRQPSIPEFSRITLKTPDLDFLDIDTLIQGNKKALILCHGLEGSSNSQYVLGLSKLALEAGWDLYALNYRGCSGRMNNQLKLYHSGATEDLDLLVQSLSHKYETVNIVGFSLGGNLVLKYLGEKGANVDSKISKCCAISAPTRLSEGSQHLKKWFNILYTKNFIRSLSSKVIAKHKQFPNDVNLEHLKKIKDVWDFDEYYTSRMHGFQGAEDYYAKCSCSQYIPLIKNKTLIINALDDPFLPSEHYPYQESKQNPNVDLLVSKYGGHIGFAILNSVSYWHEKKILTFLAD